MDRLSCRIASGGENNRSRNLASRLQRDKKNMLGRSRGRNRAGQKIMMQGIGVRSRIGKNKFGRTNGGELDRRRGSKGERRVRTDQESQNRWH